MDRNEQVNWLFSLASDIATYNPGPPGITKKDAVAITEHWLSTMELPDWFDEHDKNVLIERVRSELT